MSKLEKLEKELYVKDEVAKETLETRLKKQRRLPRTLKQPPTVWRGDKPAVASERTPLSKVLKIFIGALVIFLIVGAVAFVFFFLSTRGQEARIAILGRDELEAAERVTVPIHLKNVSTVTLREVELAVIFPQDTVIFEEGIERQVPPRYIKKINDLLPQEENTLEIQARFQGKEGEEKKIEAILLYRPENLRSRFSTRISKTIRIRRVPLSISWDIPGTLSSGQEVEVKLFYSSSARTALKNLSLRVDYPPGFTFNFADPHPAVGDNIWHIGILEPGSSGVITFRGKIIGEEGEIKTFSGEIGEFMPETNWLRSFMESSQSTKIAVKPLSVHAVLTGTPREIVGPGDILDFVILYRNNTQFSIRNVTIRTFLSGDILNFTTLNFREKAVFDDRTRSIVWSPANIDKLRELPPGTEERFHFSIETFGRPRVTSQTDKNLLVTLRTQIESSSLPKELEGIDLSSEEILTLKVRSKIFFSGKSLYRSSPILNSGPLPPKVGQKTTYTISWEIRNFTNDLENAEVRATIPPNVLWQDKVFPAETRISYDPPSGEVVWKIGEIKAGTGILTPALVGSFQVSLTPSLLDVRKSPIILNESVLRARDTFTGEDREIKFGELSTELREDPFTNIQHWTVVE